jgi:hypothetical protein
MILACCRDAATRISRSNRRVDSAAASSGESLHDHLAPEAVLVGDEHPRHASATELTLDGVTPGERLLNLRSEVGRQGALRGRSGGAQGESSANVRPYKVKSHRRLAGRRGLLSSDRIDDGNPATPAATRVDPLRRGRWSL